jgi:hypothetical protein
MWLSSRAVDALRVRLKRSHADSVHESVQSEDKWYAKPFDMAIMPAPLSHFELSKRVVKKLWNGQLGALKKLLRQLQTDPRITKVSIDGLNGWQQGEEKRYNSHFSAEQVAYVHNRRSHFTSGIVCHQMKVVMYGSNMRIMLQCTKLTMQVEEEDTPIGDTQIAIKRFGWVEVAIPREHIMLIIVFREMIDCYRDEEWQWYCSIPSTVMNKNIYIYI